MKKIIGSLIVYHLMGWKINGNFPNLKKYIILGGSHTSNWDFVLAVCTVWIRQIKVTILAKKELFRFPFAWFFRALGVLPVERKKSQNQVDAIAELFNQREQIIIGLAPEGTRKKVERLRSGFYYIAQEAKVPLVIIVVDGVKKTLNIHQPYYITNDKEKDMAYIEEQFRTKTGIVKEKSF